MPAKGEVYYGHYTHRDGGISKKFIVEGHKNDEKQNKDIAELKDLTSGIRAKKKLKESFQAYLDTHPTVKFILTQNQEKVWVEVAFLMLLSEIFKIGAISNILRIVLKALNPSER
jgi:hypothetical protein